MALSVNPLNDAEIQRRKKNLTDAQKKNAELTKEGVLVNSFIKDSKNLNELYDSMIISENVQMPEKLKENKTSQEKNLLPISLIATGVMGTMALISFIVKKSLKDIDSIPNAKMLPSLTRNLAINEETHQAIYQIVQCPNRKTVLAGLGVLTISAMGFMGKMFLDGFKEVWVKKREADIQKNLQENLISVETESFSGKIQIIRSMLAGKAKEFSDYLSYEPEKTLTFKGSDQKLAFKENQRDNNDSDKTGNLKYFALGMFTIGAIVGLGFLSIKHLTEGKKILEGYIDSMKLKIAKVVSESDSKTKEADKITLKRALLNIGADSEYIKEILSKLNWKNKADKQKFIDDVCFEINKSTSIADKAFAGDGTPKPTFYSHVNDYRAFLYNYLLDSSNPLFKNLFFGITGITALSYAGKVLGEATKDVQVKKMNAQTELNLQKTLVATELRNFKAKKDSAINPLTEEFYEQVKKGKPKEELKVIAENILYEVKNGPPFVYS